MVFCSKFPNVASVLEQKIIKISLKIYVAFYKSLLQMVAANVTVDT